MGGAKSKRTKKFAKRGGIATQIQSRRKHQQHVARVATQRAKVAERKDRAVRAAHDAKAIAAEDEAAASAARQDRDKQIEAMNIDEFLRADFLDDKDEEEEEEEEEAGEGGSGSEGEEGDSSDDDDASAGAGGGAGGRAGAVAAEEDDSDSDTGAAATSAAAAKSKKGEVSTHKSELERMKETDPEFFEFLQKNQPELLQFGQGEDEDDEEEEEAEEADDDGASSDSDSDDAQAAAAKASKKAAAEGRQVTLTARLLRKLVAAALGERSSWPALARLFQAYRAGCHLDDSLGADDTAGSKPQYRFRITSAAVHSTLMVTTLRGAHEALRRILVVKNQQGGRYDPSQSKSWSKASAQVKSFMNNTLYFLEQLTDPKMITYVLKSLKPYLCFLIPFKLLQKKCLKVVTRLWATTDHQGVRLMAFLRLRQLAVAMPFPFIGNCLKHAYLTFVRNAKFVGEHSLPALNLMINCLVDLFSLDAHSAYEHGFVYIRQLALHLRAAIVSQTKESVRNVYSWQYLNCLRVWTMVLCAQATEESSPMYPLVYPLVQVITGAVRLVPTAQHFPIRLHLVSLLNELSWSCGIYIAVAPLLLEVLHHPTFHKRLSKSTAKPLSLQLALRVPKKHLQTFPALNPVMETTLRLLDDALRANFYSVAFPEVAVHVLSQLQSFVKKVKVKTWGNKARSIANAVKRQSAKIVEKRATLTSTPADTKALANFMAGERRTAQAARARARKEEVDKLSAEAAASAKTPGSADAATSTLARPPQQSRRAARRKRARDAGDEDGDEGAEGGAGAGSDDGSDSESEDDAADVVSAPKSRRKGKGAGDEASHQAKRKRARRAASTPDVVQDLQLSDSDSD